MQKHPTAASAGNCSGIITALVIHDDDLIYPGDTFKAIWKTPRLVLGKNECGNPGIHALVLCRIFSLGVAGSGGSLFWHFLTSKQFRNPAPQSSQNPLQAGRNQTRYVSAAKDQYFSKG